MTEITGNGAGAVDANVRWATQAVRTIADRVAGMQPLLELSRAVPLRYLRVGLRRGWSTSDGTPARLTLWMRGQAHGRDHRS